MISGKVVTVKYKIAQIQASFETLKYICCPLICYLALTYIKGIKFNITASQKHISNTLSTLIFDRIPS